MLRRNSTAFLTSVMSARACSVNLPGAVNHKVAAPSPPRAAVAPAPHRTVGGVFLVHCADHPFRHSWEINKMLRDLRLEFRGQVSIHPDIPAVRKLLWRTRHVVTIERLDLDAAKELVGIPKHIQFRDLARQIPSTFGRTRAVPNPMLRSKMNFMQYRRMRLRDILHRDAVEKKLLAAKKKITQLNAQQGSV